MVQKQVNMTMISGMPYKLGPRLMKVFKNVRTAISISRETKKVRLLPEDYRVLDEKMKAQGGQGVGGATFDGLPIVKHEV